MSVYIARLRMISDLLLKFSFDMALLGVMITVVFTPHKANYCLAMSRIGIIWPLALALARASSGKKKKDKQDN